MPAVAAEVVLLLLLLLLPLLESKAPLADFWAASSVLSTPRLLCRSCSPAAVMKFTANRLPAQEALLASCHTQTRQWTEMQLVHGSTASTPPTNQPTFTNGIISTLALLGFMHVFWHTGLQHLRVRSAPNKAEIIVGAVKAIVVRIVG
jgi:hypothetical protein